MDNPDRSSGIADSFAAMDGDIARNFSGDSPPRSVAQECPRPKRVRLRLLVKQDDFSIYRACPYSLQVGGESFKGTTGPTGVIDHLVGENSKTATLTLWVEPDR